MTSPGDHEAFENHPHTHDEFKKTPNKHLLKKIGKLEDEINNLDKTLENFEKDKYSLYREDQSVFEKLSIFLKERFRLEKYYSSTDWKLKSYLQDLCPFEYYHERLELCMDKSIFNRLNVNKACKDEVLEMENCARLRERFVTEYKKWEKDKVLEMRENAFYPGSGVTKKQYQKHMETAEKQYNLLMDKLGKDISQNPNE
ncbi:hypothetical protein C9374_002200 [Naegleria lovaniensis]|uniref:Uncharacterized protein n=1 Tax=Naegleria lovaniensis TaxID=51637 RepID=A0AA88KMF9_NAELO|nr:uncharacterized protein C9374_002200 [Naegleria lovaniensis]KAG2386456.1 hypothetical protein C9374_002200 [Naegleria lovaniensis]